MTKKGRRPDEQRGLTPPPPPRDKPIKEGLTPVPPPKEKKEQQKE